MSDPMQTLQRIDEALAQLPEGDPQRQQLEALKMQLSSQAPMGPPQGLEQGLGQPGPMDMPMNMPTPPKDMNAPMDMPTNPKDMNAPMDMPTNPKDMNAINEQKDQSVGGKRINRPAQELLDALMQDRLKDEELDKKRGLSMQQMYMNK